MPNSIGGKSKSSKSGSKKKRPKATLPLPSVSVSSSARKSKGGSRGSRGSRASRGSRGKKKKHKNNTNKKKVSDGKKGEVPNQSNETIESATPSADVSTTSSTPTTTTSAPRPVPLQLLTHKDALAHDKKGKAKYALGIYRLAPGATQDILTALQKFFVWPPKTSIFVTSGYYPDIAKRGGGASGVPSNEIWIMNMDPDVSDEEVRKMFPTGFGITFEPGENGLLMAKIRYAQKAGRDKAWGKSSLRKLGPGKLDWLQPNEIKIENLSSDITEASLKARYPHSTGIVFRKDQRQAVIQFASPAKAEQEYKTLKNRKDYVDLGGRSVGMMHENENYVLKVPYSVDKDDVEDQVPDSDGVTWLESGDGNRVAVVSHGNPTVRGDSYKASPLPKQGQQLLGWQAPRKGKGKVGAEPTPSNVGVPSDEIWIMNMDPGVSDEELQKMFPGSLGITFETREDGSRMAKIKYAHKAGRDKAWGRSSLRKLGPGKLDWLHPNQIKIENLSFGITEASLKERYPHSTGIIFRKDQRQAIIQFASPGKADQEYKTLKNRKDYVDLGGRSVGMMNENENYILKVPHHVGKDDVEDQVPDSEGVHWLESGDGNRVAVVSHGDPTVRGGSYKASPLPKQGQQILGWQAPKKGKGNGKVGAGAAPTSSNLGPSGIPSNEIWITNMEPAVSNAELKRMFPGSLGITFETGEDGLRMAKIRYAQKAGRDKEWKKSSLRKLGPGKLDWVHPNEIKIENLSSDITEASLKDRYPHSTGIIFQKDHRQAFIHFASPSKADQEYKTLKNRVDYVDLGGRSVGMMNEKENYVLKVPHNVGKDEVVDIVPETNDVHWLESGDGNRVAVVSHDNPTVRSVSFKTSPLPKIGQQLLGWQAPRKGKGKVGAAPPLSKYVKPVSAPPQPEATPHPQPSTKKNDGASGVPPNEIWLMNMDPGVSDAELQKMFPGASGISFETGKNGLRMAKIRFAKNEGRDQAWGKSSLRKLGSGKLDWLHPNEIKLENLSSDITEASLKERYPHSTGIIFRKDQRHAIIQFASPAIADQEYKTLKTRKDYIDLGGRSVGMMNENENYVLKVPHHVGKDDVEGQVPNSNGVHWLESGDGTRVAVVSHGNPTVREGSFKTSPLPTQGQQLLGWQAPRKGTLKGKGKRKVGAAPTPKSQPQSSKKNDGDESSTRDGEDEVAGSAEMTDEELAARLWKAPEAAFSNLSNLFKPTLYIKKLPKSMTRTAMLKLFEGCSKVDIKNGFGIIEFDTPLKAAHGFHLGQKAVYEGSKLQILTQKPKGINKKSGQNSRGSTSTSSRSTTKKK